MSTDVPPGVGELTLYAGNIYKLYLVKHVLWAWYSIEYRVCMCTAMHRRRPPIAPLSL